LNQLVFFFNLKKPKLLAKAQKIGRPTVQAQDRNPDQTDQDQLDPGPVETSHLSSQIWSRLLWN